MIHLRGFGPCDDLTRTGRLPGRRPAFVSDFGRCNDTRATVYPFLCKLSGRLFDACGDEGERFVDVAFGNVEQRHL